MHAVLGKNINSQFQKINIHSQTWHSVDKCCLCYTKSELWVRPSALASNSEKAIYDGGKYPRDAKAIPSRVPLNAPANDRSEENDQQAKTPNDLQNDESYGDAVMVLQYLLSYLCRIVRVYVVAY